MFSKNDILDKFKAFFTAVPLKIKEFFARAAASPVVKGLVENLKWQNLYPRLKKAAGILIVFTKEQPKTAAFIYVCLFCAFSINFLDRPFAAEQLNGADGGILQAISEYNPSGWWFVILIFLWLVYMAIAGLSLTTEAFEKNLIKARHIAFVLLTLSISSLVTLFLNILVGRYTPESLDTMNLYGFSAFRFRVSETSFPCFGTQSIWAVAMAAGSLVPLWAKRLFEAVAVIITLALILTANCFISDAVMGAYIGIMMYYVAKWIVSENRENIPLITM